MKPCCNNCGTQRKPFMLGRCVACRRLLKAANADAAELRRVRRVAKKYGIP